MDKNSFLKSENFCRFRLSLKIEELLVKKSEVRDRALRRIEANRPLAPGPLAPDIRPAAKYIFLKSENFYIFFLSLGEGSCRGRLSRVRRLGPGRRPRAPLKDGRSTMGSDITRYYALLTRDERGLIFFSARGKQARLMQESEALSEGYLIQISE